jgi:hypothetical protein
MIQNFADEETESDAHERRDLKTISRDLGIFEGDDNMNGSMKLQSGMISPSSEYFICSSDCQSGQSFQQNHRS